QCFLNFVVEETLASRSAQLKEYTIATKVFERPANFDPSECPVVRVEAGRLRRLLIQHYTENQLDNLIIEIPRGSYVPKFRWKETGQPSEPNSSNRRLPILTGQIWPSNEMLGRHSLSNKLPVSVISCAVANREDLFSDRNTDRTLQLLPKFQNQCKSIASHYRGEVVSEAWDRVLLYFWSEHAQDNSAARALSAGLEILSALTHSQSDGPTGVRIGIATGTAEPTFSGIGSITAPSSSAISVAETPILAVRILHRSAPNQITIDEDTRRMLRVPAGFVNVGWLEKAQGERILLWQIIPGL